MFRKLAVLAVLVVVLMLGVASVSAQPEGCWWEWRTVKGVAQWAYTCDCNSQAFQFQSWWWGTDGVGGLKAETLDRFNTQWFDGDWGVYGRCEQQFFDCQRLFGSMVQAPNQMNCGGVASFGDTVNGTAYGSQSKKTGITPYTVIGFGINDSIAFHYQDPDTTNVGFCMMGPPAFSGDPSSEFALVWYPSDYEDPEHGQAVPLPFTTWEIDWDLGAWWDMTFAWEPADYWPFVGYIASLSVAERKDAFSAGTDQAWLYYCTFLPGAGQLILQSADGLHQGVEYWDLINWP